MTTEHQEMTSITSFGCGGLDKELDHGEIILSRRVDGVVKRYNEIKDIPLDLEKNNCGEVFINQESYQEDREDLFDKLKTWYSWLGYQIASNVDANSKMRVKRVHVFLESAKMKLRRTTPLEHDKDEDYGYGYKWLKTVI